MKAPIPSLPPTRQDGFTLIEVMVAILIMATLSLITWRSLDGIARANDRLEERSRESMRLMRALQQIERDLALHTTTELAASEALVDGGRRGNSRSGRRALETKASLLPPALQVRRQNALPFHLEIVRSAPTLPGEWLRAQWWLQGGILYRAAGTPGHGAPLAAPTAADRVAVLEDVASFEVRAWSPGQGWRSLPGTERLSLPSSGVEILLGVRGTDGEVRNYRRVVLLN